ERSRCLSDPEHHPDPARGAVRDRRCLRPGRDSRRAACRSSGDLPCRRPAFVSVAADGRRRRETFRRRRAWSGLQGLLHLLFFTAIAGLLEASLIVAARRLRPVIAAGPQTGTAEPMRVLRKGEGVPFGVAIAAGALAATHWFPGAVW